MILNNLPKIKYEAYVINLDEYKSIETHLVALYRNSNKITYFESFGVEHISKEIRKVISNKNVKTNVYRIQANDWIMWRYFCIGFIDFILKGKSLLDHTNYFSSKKYEKNVKIIISVTKNLLYESI